MRVHINRINVPFDVQALVEWTHEGLSKVSYPRLTAFVVPLPVAAG